MAPTAVIAFDLYGTLLSTESIADELAKHLGEDQAAPLASIWRRYQLEYTWRLNSMDQYMDFQTITSNALSQVLAEHNLSLTEEGVRGVMKAYDSLSVFPDVVPCLKAVSASPHVTAVIFSNGTDSMVSNSIHSSPGLSPHAKIFAQLVTVEDVRCYKPKPEAYHHVAEKVGKPRDKASMADLWLVSGNPFDVVGARNVGMKAIWVNRGGSAWTVNLMGGSDVGKPTAVVDSLEEVLDVIKSQEGKK